LEFSATAIRQAEEIIRISNRKGNSWGTTICRWYDHVTKRPENSSKKLLDIINTFSKLTGCKINLQKPVAFLYNNNEQIGKEYRKTIPYTKSTKNKIHVNKLNKGSVKPLQWKLKHWRK
jgi:hypothetical protein